MLVTVSGPSGAGKSTLIRYLSSVHRTKALPSVTTRAQRADDSEGGYYRFVSPLEYQGLVARNELVLDTSFGGNRYGTLRSDWGAAISSPEIWTADLTACSVLESYTRSLGPTLAVALSVPKRVCAERLVERGDSKSQIVSRLDAWARELFDCEALAASGCPTLFLDGRLSTRELALKVLGACERHD